MRSAWERAEAKLDLVREQVHTGPLVVLEWTKEERRRYLHRPASPKRPGWR